MRLLESKLYYQDLTEALLKEDFSFLNNSKILVTGGLGLIGSAIVDAIYVYCREHDYQVLVYVGARDEMAYLDKYGEYEQIAFLSYDALKPIEFDIQFDYIIHAASIASPELYTKYPVETILSNVIGTANLLEYSRKHAPKKLLYVSSSEVYGKKIKATSFGERDYGVIDIDDLRSSYPVAKRVSEMLCRSYAAEYGINTVIIRPGHVYGPSARNEDKRVSSDFAYKAANGVDLEMKSSGLQKRSYIYSIDCAIATLVALKNGLNGDAYNVANKEIVSIREMAQHYAKAGNVNLSIVVPSDEERRAFNPMDHSDLDGRKLEEIGYRPFFNSEMGFLHTVEIIKSIMKSNQ